MKEFVRYNKSIYSIDIIDKGIDAFKDIVSTELLDEGRYWKVIFGKSKINKRLSILEFNNFLLNIMNEGIMV